MKRYGTPIVAGVTPGKGGQIVHGIPVYDSVETACERHAPDTTVLFVPALAVKQAALDAIRGGVKYLVVLAEHVPVHDVMDLLAEASDRGVQVIGPNCPGVVVPGRHAIGIMPAAAENIFRPGTVGVVSRSGSLGTLVCLNLIRAGLGQSAFIGIGGDSIVGTTFRDAFHQLEVDPGTKVIVMLGEVGGAMEEDAAELIASMTKSVVAFVAGKTVPEGKRMGHAGAIVSGDRGTARRKVETLRAAGAHIADVPSQVGVIARRVLE
jgi:succinyl-CoA synthetase alpha subunit